MELSFRTYVENKLPSDTQLPAAERCWTKVVSSVTTNGRVAILHFRGTECKKSVIGTTNNLYNNNEWPRVSMLPFAIKVYTAHAQFILVSEGEQEIEINLMIS